MGRDAIACDDRDWLCDAAGQRGDDEEETIGQSSRGGEEVEGIDGGQREGENR